VSLRPTIIEHHLFSEGNVQQEEQDCAAEVGGDDTVHDIHNDFIQVDALSKGGGTFTKEKSDHLQLPVDNDLLDSAFFQLSQSGKQTGRTK
jgi:hypothetical protein